MKYKKVVQLPFGTTKAFCQDMHIDYATWYRWRVVGSYPDMDMPETIRLAALRSYGGKIVKVPVHRFE